MTYIPPEILEVILSHVSTSDRHWEAVLRGSLSLWCRTVLILDDLDDEDVPELAKWLRNHAHGIRELEVHFSDSSWWSNAAFLMGVVGSSLTRLDLRTVDCVNNDMQWLGSLGGLQELHLAECLGQFPPCLAKLAALRELVVHHADDTGASYCVPEQLSRLAALTRLELRNGLRDLPPTLGRLTALRLLALEAVCLAGRTEPLNAQLAELTGLEELGLFRCSGLNVPSMLSALTRLTCLALPACFDAVAWVRARWESELQVLAPLTRLEHLDLSENNLAFVPCLIASLPLLSTLDVSLNPLTDGLASGPYPALQHLDLHGSSIRHLPDSLCNARQLSFLGLSCCHSLDVDKQLVESVLGNLAALESITLCGSMLESVESAKAMLALGRMLPRVEVYSQDELDGSDAGHDHHHDDSDDEDDDDLYSSTDEDETDDGESEDDSDEETDEEDAESDASSEIDWRQPLG